MSAGNRPTELVEGYEALVVRAVELVGQVPGAKDFELAYEAADRVLEEGEEPRPDEAVAWRASATVRRKYHPGTKPIERTFYGTAIVRPGGLHDQGIVDAVVTLLRNMGANVNVLIVREDPE